MSRKIGRLHPLDFKEEYEDSYNLIPNRLFLSKKRESPTSCKTSRTLGDTVRPCTPNVEEIRISNYWGVLKDVF